MHGESSLDSVSVCVTLVWPSHFHSNIICLLLTQLRKVGAQSWEVKTCNFLIKLLGQQIHFVLVAFAFLPIFQEIQLAKDLVGERARHDKGWMPCGTAEVAQAARCEHDNAMAIREDESVHLRFDVLNLDAWKTFKCGHFNLIVEVTNVAYDGVVLHLFHSLQSDDLEIASGCDENIRLARNLIKCGHLEALHACLQSTDRVDLCDEDASTCATHCEAATLAHITIAADDCTLASNHHVGCAHDGVGQRVTATVHVIKFGLGDTIIYVDCWKQKLTFRGHLFQSVHTGGCLFANTLALFLPSLYT